MATRLLFILFPIEKAENLFASLDAFSKAPSLFLNVILVKNENGISIKNFFFQKLQPLFRSNFEANVLSRYQEKDIFLKRKKKRFTKKIRLNARFYPSLRFSKKKKKNTKDKEQAKLKKIKILCLFILSFIRSPHPLTPSFNNEIRFSSRFYAAHVLARVFL